MSRRRWRLLAPALLLVGIAACRGDHDDRHTLTFWAMGRESEAVAQLMPAFEREHPDIRVDVQQLPWKAAHQKLLTAIAGDTTPDVAQLGNTWLAEMCALDALEPLQP